MKTARKKIIYVLCATLYAFGIFQITQIIFFEFAAENAFFATIGNFAMIFLFLIGEKFEKLIARKTQMGRAWVKWLLKFYLTGPSFKSAMYLFYIVALIYTALYVTNPDFPTILPYEYLFSVRYGALVLIAGDKFMEQIFKDIKSDEEIGESGGG